ncbi:hypothetical protein pb186bvf_011762 [Paramecium bursaria]
MSRNHSPFDKPKHAYKRSMGEHQLTQVIGTAIGQSLGSLERKVFAVNLENERVNKLLQQKSTEVDELKRKNEQLQIESHTLKGQLMTPIDQKENNPIKIKQLEKEKQILQDKQQDILYRKYIDQIQELENTLIMVSKEYERLTKDNEDLQKTIKNLGQSVVEAELMKEKNKYLMDENQRLLLVNEQLRRP